MILRRVIKHFRNQEWTAIFLDFIIVVVGVFVGLQVANWNEVRALKVQERGFLIQLRQEVREIDRIREGQARFTNRIIEGGRAALAFLDGGEDCIKDCEALLIDFFHATQTWGNSFPMDKYREVDRLGFPTNEATRAAVQGLYQGVEAWGVVNQTPPVYRERLRGYLTPDASAALWGDCYSLREGMFEDLLFDCAADLQKLDTAAMLRAIRSDAALAGQLRYWLGQNIFAAQEYQSVRDAAAAAIAAITDDVGDEQ